MTSQGINLPEENDVFIKFTMPHAESLKQALDEISENSEIKFEGLAHNLQPLINPITNSKILPEI